MDKIQANIELRSEEVQDVLNRPPSWMISWGNTAMLLIVLIGFCMSYFIKYPDVILGEAIISTGNPPLYVGTSVKGRVDKVIIQNGQWVNEGDLLIELQNPVDSKSILFLSDFISKVNAFLTDPKVEVTYNKLDLPELFDATSQFLQLTNEIGEFKNFLFDQNTLAPRKALLFKLDQAKKMKEISQRELKLSKSDIINAKEKFSMQKEEYEKGYITRLAFLNAQSTYNSSLKQQESLNRVQLEFVSTIFDLGDQLEQFDHDRVKRIRSFREQIEKGLSSLENFIVNWENNYTIKSPADGQVEFLQRLEEKQYLSAMPQLIAIIQENKTFEVIAAIPREGFGKITIGNQVRLKVNNYPSHEYGALIGEVVSVSSLSTENQYTVKIDLVQGLTTSYNKVLKYTPEMTATAEIITEDLRLIERLFNSVRTLFVN